MDRLFHLVFTLLSLAALLAGCSSTTLNSAWKDPEFRGPVRKIYLVGIARQEPNRQLFEDTFNRELAALGATGIPSYRDLPTDEADSQEAIVARLNRNGADSILMVRVTRLRIEEVNSTPYVAARSTWNSYYESRYEYVYTPPMTTEFEVATIEANLYDAKTGTLIWLANLETVIGGDLEKVFGDFARTVTRDLQKQGLL